MREFFVLDPGNWTATRQNMSSQITTLWSVYPLGIVRKERDGLEAFNGCSSHFRRPLTEVGAKILRINTPNVNEPEPPPVHALHGAKRWNDWNSWNRWNEFRPL
jgi:hypothetical protein